LIGAIHGKYEKLYSNANFSKPFFLLKYFFEKYDTATFQNYIKSLYTAREGDFKINGLQKLRLTKIRRWCKAMWSLLLFVTVRRKRYQFKQTV